MEKSKKSFSRFPRRWNCAKITWSSKITYYTVTKFRKEKMHDGTCAIQKSCEIYKKAKGQKQTKATITGFAK